MAAVPHHHHLLFVIFLFFLIPLCFSSPDGDALLDFKKSLKNTALLDSTWKKGTSPCEGKKHWLGVACNKDKVHSLNLMGLGLSGDIDVVYLSNLDILRGIHLANNSFTGPIPAFNKLGALKTLFLHDNQFSGEISSGFFATMGSLKKVWLSGNKFSGPVPGSLGKLHFLMEVHLDRNQFSGPIPTIDQPSLKEIDLSNNNLEGEIPESMSKFGADSFEGNPGLCGAVLKKDCKADVETTTSSSENPKSTNEGPPNEQPSHEEETNGSATKYVIVGVVVAVLIITILFKAKRKEDDFSVLGKENLDEVVSVHVSSTHNNRRSTSSTRKGGGGGESAHSGSRRGGSSHGGGGGGRSVGDLVMINDEKGSFGLQDLMKAAAEVLGNGNLGSAYKAVMSNGVSVVVKRLREMNKFNRDGFDAEMKRLGKLKHKNILTPLSYHYRKDEKLVVSEFVPKGSLLFLLHGDRGISHAQLNWPTRLKIIQGVARGMGFIHTEFSSSELPHGNLKSSNVLLAANYEPLLTDYAFYPLISNTQTAQSLFAYKSPEAILYQQVTPKSDVYCLGIIILEVLTGKFPSQYLNNQKGGTDLVHWVRSMMKENKELELIDPEIASTMASLPQMEKLLHIAAACTESEQENRINMNEAIARIEEIQV